MNDLDIIRLYYADVSVLADESAFRSAYNAVSPERRKKTDAYRFGKDKYLSLGAELLLQKALGDLGCPAPVGFSFGGNGKPYLKNAPGVYFNLSHSGKYAVCALSSAEVGCDIEEIRSYPDAVAKKILTQREYAELLSIPEAERKNTAFFRYWTLKESFIKYTGSGFGGGSLPEIRFSEREIAAYVDGQRQDCSLFECSLVPGCAIGICSAERKRLELFLTDLNDLY